MSKAADLARTASASETALSNRNVVTNGAMQIWQRGVSQTTTGYGCVDRFRNTVSGTVTFSQETTGLPSGFVYALKWTTGAATSYGQSRQFIETENVKALRGETVTASAYVKVSGDYSGIVTWEIAYSTGGDVSGSTWIGITESNVISASASDASSDYKRISCNVTIPDNAVGIYVGIVPSAVQASGVTCSITGVQLEVGTVTPFEHRSYGQELALCQRYYYRIQGNGSANTSLGVGFASTTTTGYSYLKFPVNMRAAPTIDGSSGLTASDLNSYTVAYASVGLNATESSSHGSSATYIVVTVSSGLTALRPNANQLSNNAGSFLSLTAEL